MPSRRAVTRVFAAAVIGGALILGGGAHADPLKIRMGWVAAPASLIPILFAKDGVAKHNGISYTVEPNYFKGSPLQITTLQSGDLDIAALGFSSIGLAVQNAGINDLRIIADEIQNGVPGYGGTEFAVLKDSPIKTVEDLKGKVLATNGIGGGLDTIAKAMLLKHGLVDKRDYSVIEVAFPSMKPVLMEHKADLVDFALPWSQEEDFKNNSRILFTTNEAMGNVALSFWVARTGFIEKNRAAMVDLMEDYIRVIHWYIDPANHDEAVQIVAKFLKLDPKVMQGWLFTKQDNYRDPNGMPDLDAITRNVHVSKELGFVKADLDARKYADLSMIQEAAKRLQTAAK
jgi:NitT/TauT family transport system substrate-binding protein